MPLSAVEPVADDRRSVAEFLEQWLSYAEQRVRARTFERYCSIVRQHLIPQLGKLQLAKHARYRGHGTKAEKDGVLA